MNLGAVQGETRESDLNEALWLFGSRRCVERKGVLLSAQEELFFVIVVFILFLIV